ncbi:MAG: hypothetical protein IJZ53_04060 [Tyzzerella sp.]|nr:hypothetical protein [Tyzzerella sp.]
MAKEDEVKNLVQKVGGIIMKKLFKAKITASVLMATLFFQIFSINSFAMTSQESPKNLTDITLEANEETQVQEVQIDSSNTRVVDENRIYYTEEFTTVATNDGNGVMFNFEVRYIWSVDGRSPSNSLAIESVKVIDDTSYVTVVRSDGPSITKTLNAAKSQGICSVTKGYLTLGGYYNIYQYATLTYQGNAYFDDDFRQTAG